MGRGPRPPPRRKALDGGIPKDTTKEIQFGLGLSDFFALGPQGPLMQSGCVAFNHYDIADICHCLKKAVPPKGL